MKWFNIKDYEKDFKATSIFIGGRGIGKTYSTLCYLLDSGKIFLYLRNTDVQLDECCGDFGNPFKRINKDKGRNIYIKKEKKHGVIYEDLGGDLKILGYAAALSTSGDLKGMDLSDVDFVIFDEFIENRTLNFDQKEKFDKFYETVNRNRELFGEKPLYCFLLSNADKLDNPILSGNGLIPYIEKMMELKQEKFKIKNFFICLAYSEISEMKKKTVLYQNIKGSKEYDNFIENKFSNDSFYGIRKRPLVEYTGLCQIDDIFIYKHKSKNQYYATFRSFSNPNKFTSKDNKLMFYRSYGRFLVLAASDGSLEYDSFLVKSLLQKILA